MSDLRYTLLTDGSSDRALTFVLTWLLKDLAVKRAIQPAWADLRRLPNPPKSLHERIRTSIDLYPCDLLFVHRDAEKEPLGKRVSEIQNAVTKLGPSQAVPPAVCVVPVRMQEAWLLFDEAAIRRAAGNPSGRQSMQLPKFSAIESLPDPKSRLHALLRQASGLAGRRLDRFSVSYAAQRVADLIDDFSPLRVLTAFQHLDKELANVIRQHGWDG